MSTLNVTTLKHEASATDNITLDSAGNTVVSGGLKTPSLVLPSGSSFAIKDSSNVDTYIGVDSAGRVTMPYQPSFRVSKNASAANSNSDVIFDVVHHNIGGHYSTSTGRFTAPIAGRYLFCVVNNMGASAQADMFLRRNGVTIAGVEYDPATGGTAYWLGSSIPIILDLSANDYIQIYINGTPAVGVEGAYWNNFSGQLIG